MSETMKGRIIARTAKTIAPMVPAIAQHLGPQQLPFSLEFLPSSLILVDWGIVGLLVGLRIHNMWITQNDWCDAEEGVLSLSATQ